MLIEIGSPYSIHDLVQCELERIPCASGMRDIQHCSCCETEVGAMRNGDWDFGKASSSLSGKTAVPETQVSSLLCESGRRGFFIISKGSKK